MNAPPPLAAVLGNPIGHSLSPRIHGYWLRKYGLSGHYHALEVAAEDLPNALKGIATLGLAGVNLTMPHKEIALAYLDDCSPLARRVGAANMVTRQSDGRLFGDNSDVYGFTTHLQASLPGFVPRRAAIIGSGGAARAVLVALLDMGVRAIAIISRNPDKAMMLASYLPVAAGVHDLAAAAAGLEGVDLLVNCSPLGMRGQENLPLDIRPMAKDAAVYDLVYAPLETELLQQARQSGRAAIDGLGMLLHQAAPGFAQWFGVKPDIDAALRQAVLA